jgi:TPR repeat protein
MKNLTATICLTIAVLVGSVGISWSADFQKGLTAAQSGDFEIVLREWTPLAKQGDVHAQYLLGLMYAEGKGVPQDYKSALKWYSIAAEQGDAPAQYQLAVMYDKGVGVRLNQKTAMKWYSLAAEQGYAAAQSDLALMYDNGTGVIQDNNYAYMWWNFAASSGDKGAVKNRDLIAKRMTPSQLEKAQRLIQECARKKYKGC